MKILVTGGCGYKGSVLIPKLILEGHQIINIDNQWFGNYLSEYNNLKNIKADISNITQEHLNKVDVVIHLANIANDPAVELNPTLSWEVNVLESQQLASKAVKAGVKQFIYASSGSVYGVKEEPNVTEDLELVPISTYNKTKMVAERIFLSYSKEMQVHCIRPATVCGVSPRMRLDVSVNMLTFQALKNKKITVFGGDQTRPNIHINDMINVYLHFLKNREIAELIKEFVECEIVKTESNDPRSYRQDSSKLLSTGFKLRNNVKKAILDIKDAYKKNSLNISDSCYTVKWMKKLSL